jgi:hypothetical protein
MLRRKKYHFFLEGNKMKKIEMIILLVAAIFLAGLAGCTVRMDREGHPITYYQPGDEDRTCFSLKTEIAQLQIDMLRLLPKTKKTSTTNALWETSGVFFEMDYTQKVEFNAMRQRHNRLLIDAKEKGCDMGEIRAEDIPSLEKNKEEAAKSRQEAAKHKIEAEKHKKETEKALKQQKGKS